MTLDFLEDMDQQSLTSIIKQASIQLSNKADSKIEVINKQSILGISNVLSRIQNEFNKTLAFSSNVTNIQKNAAADVVRAVNQNKIERPRRQTGMDLDLPDIGPVIDKLAKSLEDLDLSGGGDNGGILAQAAGMLGGRSSALGTAAKVAGGAALAYGGYKLAERALPSMLRASEPKVKPKAVSDLPSGTDSTSVKKGQQDLAKLNDKATMALNKPLSQTKPTMVEEDSISSQFSDYLSNTLKNVNSYVQSIPERLSDLGNSLYDTAAGGIEAAGEFFGGIGDGFEASMAGGAATAPYSFVESSLGINSQKWDIYRNTIAQIESQGRYDISGGSGDHYDGRYQMGKSAKSDAGRILNMKIGHDSQSRAAFRSNKELQEKAFAAYTSANNRTLEKYSPTYRKAKDDEKLQILGYAHNQGAGGAIKWLKTGKAGKDGFGTSGTKYSSALASTLRNPTAARLGSEIGEAAGNLITGASSFITPVLGGKRISSPFGMRVHPKTGKRKMHTGVDYGHGGESAPAIYAAAGGTVQSAGMAGGYGNMVAIKHPNGYLTKYAHLSSMKVKRGAIVEKGQLIGKMGTTGMSTGVHLHFEIRDPSNRPINPLSVTGASKMATSEPVKPTAVAPAAQQAAIAKKTQTRQRTTIARGGTAGGSKVFSAGKGSPAKSKNSDSSWGLIAYLTS